MLTKADPIPKGFHTVTPYIVADDAGAVIKFMRQAFGAEHDHEPTMRPDGKIMHATLRLGSSRVMVASSSEHTKASPVMLYIYVPNVDAVFKMAERAGGETIMQPSDMFYGDRTGGVKDPAGNQWFIGTHVEDIPVADIQKRANEMFRGEASLH